MERTKGCWVSSCEKSRLSQGSHCQFSDTNINTKGKSICGFYQSENRKIFTSQWEGVTEVGGNTVRSFVFVGETGGDLVWVLRPSMVILGHYCHFLPLSQNIQAETATNNFYGRLETRRQRNEKCGSIQGNYVTASVMTFHTPWSQSRGSWPCTCHVPGIMMNGATLLSIFESLRDNILSHMYFSPFLLVDRGWPGGE